MSAKSQVSPDSVPACSRLALLRGCAALQGCGGHSAECCPVVEELPGRAQTTMADTKGANISRMVLKQAGRAKEKVGWQEAGGYFREGDLVPEAQDTWASGQGGSKNRCGLTFGQQAG